MCEQCGYDATLSTEKKKKEDDADDAQHKQAGKSCLDTKREPWR
jgi:hypothetical protein